MMNINILFEVELKKILEEEIDRIKEAAVDKHYRDSWRDL